MADTRIPDGLDENELGHSSNITHTKLSGPDISTSGRTRVSADLSASRHTKMDRDEDDDGGGGGGDDDDGAPSVHESPQRLQKGERHNMDRPDQRENVVTFDSSAESTPRKLSAKPRSFSSTPQISTTPRGPDLSLVDMKTSWDGSSSSKAGLLADPAKIAKEREKEERVRQARERLLGERQKKVEELREQQRLAQENRDKQLEMRRKKIEDLRRRDIERRQAVEERRKIKENVEKARRETILQKAEERVARYEAWKAGGRKGGRGHVLGFGSATPRDICQPLERPRRSSSQSALHRHSPNGSDMDSVRPQRRALSACSAVRRHCCVYINRSGTFSSTPTASSTATHHYQRPSNAGSTGSMLSRASMTASLPNPVRMREKSSRKPRPASVASSMPSSSTTGDLVKSARSKSSERKGRDRSKTQLKTSGEKTQKVRDSETPKPEGGEEKADEDKNHGADVGKERSVKKEKKDKVSLTFVHRMSAPKPSRKDPETTSPPKKDVPVIHLSPRKAYSTSNLAMMRKKPSIKDKKSPTVSKDSVPKIVQSKEGHHGAASSTNVASGSVSSVRSASPARKDSVRVSSPSRKRSDVSGTTSPPPTSMISTAAPAGGSSSPAVVPVASPVADDGTTVPRPAVAAAPAQDISAEEYKARLAEKRRQARERAEREAEEERRRQEEEKLAEEERQRQEEEEEKRLEEESLHFAEEARRAEEARLQKAIEAEERRRKEEAEKLEQEKKAREETERKMKVEAERLEKEKQEKARRDEEDRLERKKKLEMIMKRVKTDTESPVKPEALVKPVVHSVTHLDSPHSSPEDDQEKSEASSEVSTDSSNLSVVEGSHVEVYSADMTTSFMQDMDESAITASTASPEATVTHSVSSEDIVDSPAGNDEKLPQRFDSTPKIEEKVPSSELDTESEAKFRPPFQQQLAENKEDDSSSGSPKFKSPLLQNLLGKNKVGARMGFSSSTGDLNKDTPSTHGQDVTEEALSTKPSAFSKESSGSSEMLLQQEMNVVKDEGLSVTQARSSQISPEEEEQEKSSSSGELSSEEGSSRSVMEGSNVEVYGADMTTSFMQGMDEASPSDSSASPSSFAFVVKANSGLDEALSLVQAHDGSGEASSGRDEALSLAQALDSSGEGTGEVTAPSKSEATAPPHDPSSFEPQSRLEAVTQEVKEEEKKEDLSVSSQFKSPLLQNIFGKSKFGPYLGLSSSTGDLSLNKDTALAHGQDVSEEVASPKPSALLKESRGSLEMTESTGDLSDNKEVPASLSHPEAKSFTPEDSGKVVMKHKSFDDDDDVHDDDDQDKAGNLSVTNDSSSQEISPEEEQEKSAASSVEAFSEEGSSLSLAEGSAVKVYNTSMTTSYMQDLEEPSLTASTSSSASTVTRSVSSGNILEGSSYSFKGEEEERLTHSADTTPSKNEERILTTSSETKPKFKSPLLQQLMENRGGNSSRITSPLIQNILGKTKAGSRLGLSASMGDLSNNKDSAQNQASGKGNSYVTLSGRAEDSTDSCRDTFRQGSGYKDNNKDIFANDSPRFGQAALNPFDSRATSNGAGGDSSSGASSNNVDHSGDLWVMSQSFIYNGHGDYGAANSRSDFFPPEEGVTKRSPSNPFENFMDSERQQGATPTQNDGHFEELIDLMDTNGMSTAHMASTPIRTFEETGRRSDVTDFLS